MIKFSVNCSQLILVSESLCKGSSVPSVRSLVMDVKRIKCFIFLAMLFYTDGWVAGRIYVWPIEAHSHTQTHTHPFYGPLDFVRDYPGEPVPEPIWILLKQDSERQWHQLDHMQICTSPQTDNHASTSPLSFLQAECPSCHPTNSVKALKVKIKVHSSH